MTARDRTPRVHSPGVLAIPLTRGLFALVDEADGPLVAPYKWCVLHGSDRMYAARRVGGRRAKQTIMHRVILDAPAGLHVDHINGDGLDNRRTNLRLATNRQNCHNRNVLNANNKSGFRGVYWNKNDRAWVAEAHDNSGRKVRLGSHHSALDAARAYDSFVVRERGAFARTNLPHGTLTS